MNQYGTLFLKISFKALITWSGFPLTSARFFWGELKKAARDLSWVIVIKNLALRWGSSKQGKAHRAYVGSKLVDASRLGKKIGT